MDTKTNSSFRKGFVNLFGGLGYLSCTVQWLLVFLLYFSLLQGLVNFISPETNEPVKQPVQVITTVDYESNIFMTILAIIIVAAIFMLTFYMVFKVPKTIVKTSERIVHKTAESVAPIVFQIQHKKETPKTKTKLTLSLVPVIKLVIISAPVILTYFSNLLEKQALEFNIALTIGWGLAGISFVLFVAQYLIAKLLRVNIKEIW